jgi:hypothetical protein
MKTNGIAIGQKAFREILKIKIFKFYFQLRQKLVFAFESKSNPAHTFETWQATFVL